MNAQVRAVPHSLIARQRMALDMIDRGPCGVRKAAARSLDGVAASD